MILAIFYMAAAVVFLGSLFAAVDNRVKLGFWGTVWAGGICFSMLAGMDHASPPTWVVWMTVFAALLVVRLFGSAYMRMLRGDQYGRRQSDLVRQRAQR